MIPISIPHLYKEDKQYAIKAIKDGYIGQGDNIKLFEEKFSNYCGRTYGVTCSNGTVALYLAIKALNLPKGSEVIIPSMTIVSCLTAVLENDLIPVFCDVHPDTWNIDFKSALYKINSNTSAVIVIDTYGLTVSVDDILSIKLQYPDIKIIEDASEAHGASYWDYKAGSIGDISTFSFYSNKIITTGEGGMILTDDIKIYERLISHRNLNFIERNKYIHSEAGWNFNVYWYYGIVVKKNYDKVLKALEDNNIEYRHFFYPLHKQPFIDSKEVIKNSEFSFENGILLPIFNKLTTSQIKLISEVILKEVQ
jgi:perosamine synthetase